MIKLHAIDAGLFKLDGGAMFGVVPKILWNKLNPADEQNLCTWALRCLLVETDDRLILIDTGIGNKQDEKFLSLYHLHGEGDLLSSIENAGFKKSDITDVFLTHWHFDHCGGALTRDAAGHIVPEFENAKYWTCRSHYDWALNPNPRERASFIRDNIQPLEEAGVLHFVEENQNGRWIENISVFFAYGHTEAMMIPVIDTGDKKIAFMADLLPSSFHVRMPYVMGYDVRPLETLNDKRTFFEQAIAEDYYLFLEHDPVTECIKIGKNDRGRYEVKEKKTLLEVMS